MNVLTQLTPAQLRKAADIQERIQILQKDLGQILSGQTPIRAAKPASTEAPQTRDLGKKWVSAKSRAKMAASQRARRAAEKGEVTTPLTAPLQAKPAAEKPKKKALSEARLNALAKARQAKWAKANVVQGKKAKGKR